MTQKIRWRVSIHVIHSSFHTVHTITKCIKTELVAELFCGQCPPEDFTKEDYRKKCGISSVCVRLLVNAYVCKQIQFLSIVYVRSLEIRRYGYTSIRHYHSYILLICYYYFLKYTTNDTLLWSTSCYKGKTSAMSYIFIYFFTLHDCYILYIIRYPCALFWYHDKALWWSIMWSKTRLKFIGGQWQTGYWASATQQTWAQEHWERNNGWPHTPVNVL